MAAAAVAACSGGSGRRASEQLRSEDDSVAYVLGMHVGRNLMAMDSTLNVAAVCEGIREVFASRERMTDEQARTFYLRFVNYTKPERIRAYEEQFLEDIRRQDRTYARTSSGLTYSVEVGDESVLPRSETDSVTIRYVLRHADGRVISSSYERQDTLRTTLGEMREGVREAIRLTGKGGKISVWVPSSLAYGAEGDSQAGIAPNETLFYEIELLDVTTGGRRRPISAGAVGKTI